MAGWQAAPSVFPLAVAVSGGSDSMALLLMAHAAAVRYDLPLVALTIDHGLRSESREEAETVAHFCALRGIDHHILSVRASGITLGGRQEEARTARYDLLIQWCKSHGFTTLATAHHLNDQVETLFMRLMQGSGIIGLACIARETNQQGVKLIRPLLKFSKTELQDYLKAHDQSWIEDPSNHKLHYTRNHIRARLEQEACGEQFMSRAGRVIDCFARMRILMERHLEQAFIACAWHKSGDKWQLSYSAFTSLPQEIALMLLARTCVIINGRDHPPRSAKLQRLYVALLSPSFTAASLGRLRFTLNEGKTSINITREDLKNAAEVPY